MKRARNRPEKSRPVSANLDRSRPRIPRSLTVLYEDDAVIVLDKPAGLLAVPIKGSEVPSALSLLWARLKLKRQRAFVVHRIDRFASGILLFAKTAADRNELVRQFLDHIPARQYLAVVRGRLAADRGTLVHYFRREGMFQRLLTAQDPETARGELRYRVERVFDDAALVRVELVTGLQNQIRAQFAAIGHPVVGDRKYRPEESSERLIDRVALHATHLRFVHPRKGESVDIHCEAPSDFRHLLQNLPASRRGDDRAVQPAVGEGERTDSARSEIRSLEKRSAGVPAGGLFLGLPRGQQRLAAKRFSSTLVGRGPMDRADGNVVPQRPGGMGPHVRPPQFRPGQAPGRGAPSPLKNPRKQIPRGPKSSPPNGVVPPGGGMGPHARPFRFRPGQAPGPGARSPLKNPKKQIPRGPKSSPPNGVVPQGGGMAPRVRPLSFRPGQVPGRGVPPPPENSRKKYSRGARSTRPKT